MHLSSPAFPFVRVLENSLEIIREEADRLRVSEYSDWPIEESYVGGWKVFCLFSRDPEWLFAHTCAKNATRCPRTEQLLSKIPGVVRGGFSMLLPGTHVFEHTDEAEDSMRCHLGIRTNAGAKMRMAGEVIPWTEGRCLLFDGSVPHEAVNLGDEPRIVCLVDIDRSWIEGNRA